MNEASYKQALKIPHAEDGMTIGLLGGSFNPPHEGHVHISELVLQRLQLHKVWWLASPGNPLKNNNKLPDLNERLTLCQKLVSNPKIEITGFEAKFHTRYTADTLALLKRIRPRLNFIWIMGADNLAQFHHWQDWRKIAAMMPMVVIDRPGSTLSFRSARAAQALARYRKDPDTITNLAFEKPPAWTFIHGPRSNLSSTAIRAKSSN
ncbi:MAG: nicotinate-nucleotide adenylyltransferase [Rhizobiaceae bacterium]